MEKQSIEMFSHGNYYEGEGMVAVAEDICGNCGECRELNG